MQFKTLIALISFIMTICAPFQFNIHTDTDSNTTSFFTLNVCHASGSAMSVQADIPFINACTCEISISESSLAYAVSDIGLLPLLIGLQSERPPRV